MFNNSDSITSKDKLRELDKICRVCLVLKKDMRPIFGEVLITEMLYESTSVKIENIDGWPDKICVQCVHAVSRCHAFKTLVQKNDKELRQYIKSITVFDNTAKEPTITQPSVMNVTDPTSFHETLPQIVLTNGQILNTTQIVSHNGQPLEILPAELSQLLQSGNTVQMIGQNGQTQLLQLESTGQEDCEIIMDPIDDTQYFEDVTVTTHDDIETTEDVIQLEEEEEETIFEEQITEEDEESSQIIQEEFNYDDHENVENDSEDLAEKEYMAEFISSQVSMPMPGKYVCNLCHKEFRQYRWMENHLKSHSNWIRANCKKQPQCEICHRSFKGPGMLRMHMKTHEVSDKVPTCSICSKQFKSKTILYRHRQIHQLRSYSCGLCSKSFSTALTLNTHITKKHPNETAVYKCAECSILFCNLEQLKNHIENTGHSGKTLEREGE